MSVDLVPDELDERSAYDAIDAVNWSRLKLLRKSPLHFLHCSQPADSAAFKVGRATHAATLEPHRFERDFVIYEGAVRRGKEWDRFRELNWRKTILLQDEHDRARAMAAAVRGHELVAPLLAEGGEVERTVVWTDPKTGLKLKGRLDWLGRVVLDLKTSRNAIDPRTFALDAYKLGYFHQLELYRRGVAAERGVEEGPPALIVAVETEVPYDVVAYPINEDALHFAGKEIDELLATLVQCRAENKWPGKFSAPQDLNLPRWAFPSAEDMTVPPLPDWLQGV